MEHSRRADCSDVRQTTESSYDPKDAYLSHPSRVGELLVEIGRLTPAELAYVSERGDRRGVLIGEVLVDEGFVTENELLDALNTQAARRGMRYYTETDPDMATA